MNGSMKRVPQLIRILESAEKDNKRSISAFKADTNMECNIYIAHLLHMVANS